MTMWCEKRNCKVYIQIISRFWAYRVSSRELAQSQLDEGIGVDDLCHSGHIDYDLPMRHPSGEACNLNELVS